MRPRHIALLCLALLGLGALAGPAAGNLPQPPAKLRYTWTLMWVGPGKGVGDIWELDIQNTNDVKFINAFSWAPPDGLTVIAVTGSEGGRCALIGPTIKCSGNIAPTSCGTCEGGMLTVHFTGNGFDPIWVPTDDGGTWANAGWSPGTVNVTATSSAFSDLPLCKKGQVSTKRKPCAKRG